MLPVAVAAIYALTPLLGFDVSQPRSEMSFGLIGMKERAESLGGEFRLESEPGQGTSVEVVLP